MKTTAIILLALMLGTVSCRSEQRTVNKEAETSVAETSVTEPSEVELPVWGNFQLASNDDGSLLLIGFYPENGLEIFNFSFDEQEGMPIEKSLFSGTYHVVKQSDANVYIVEFELKSDDQKTTQTGRIKMEYSDTTSEGVELHNYKITPLKGYDLGLPVGEATEVPISAWQAWD